MTIRQENIGPYEEKDLHYWGECNILYVGYLRFQITQFIQRGNKHDKEAHAVCVPAVGYGRKSMWWMSERTGIDRRE